MRGDPDHFLHSKLLCWVALDRAVRLGEAARMPGDIPRWRRTREEIRQAMPTIAGIGLTPLLQWIVIPAMILMVVRRTAPGWQRHP